MSKKLIFNLVITTMFFLSWATFAEANQPPTLSVSFPSGKEGTFYDYTVSASDPDGDSLHYSM
ncbi:hypothetical protein, partial [Thalassotalea sp. PP2-459]|uniref:hypothetical protein n=1 Tax=Thalassotalea sp. PP2-459 TaxID=1742724 RepID=UPI001C37D355